MLYQERVATLTTWSLCFRAQIGHTVHASDGSESQTDSTAVHIVVVLAVWLVGPDFAGDKQLLATRSALWLPKRHRADSLLRSARARTFPLQA